jgi:hypothetical protein
MPGKLIRSPQTDGDIYQIRVQGHLSSNASTWFEGLVIHNEANGEAVLTGALVDQAALYGILLRIQSLGLTLIGLTRVEEASSLMIRRTH